MKQKQFRNENRYTIEMVPDSSKNEANFTKENYRSRKGDLQKILFLIVILLGTSSISSAQFKWGVKLGANASTQSDIGNIYDNTAIKAGFNIGIIAKYQMNEWVALKSGIDYQTKGKQGDTKGQDLEIKNDLRYLILPVKAEFSASEKAGFKKGQRLFFATGPYFGYLLDAEETIQEQTTDLKDLKDFDFGWSFELGMEFPFLKNKTLQVSLNYDMGFSEISDDSDIQNKSASLNLGFLF